MKDDFFFLFFFFCFCLFVLSIHLVSYSWNFKVDNTQLFLGYVAIEVFFLHALATDEEDKDNTQYQKYNDDSRHARDKRHKLALLKTVFGVF